MGRPRKIERFQLRTIKGKHGKQSYEIVGYRSTGERIRKRFKVKTDAINYRAELESEIENDAKAPTLQRTSLTPEQLSDAEVAVGLADDIRLAQTITHYRKLKEALESKHDISLDQAIAFTLSHYKPDIEELSILKARERFINSRKGIEEKTKEHYENSTKLLIKEPNKLVHEFTVSDIDKALSKYKNANSHQTYRRGIRTFFNWAKRYNHCLENPCDRLDKAPTVTTDISILAPDEVKRLLKASTILHDGVMASSIAILLFAGLRPSELRDLKPEDVKEGRIRVKGGKLRRKLKRSVDIPPVLSKWLEKYKFTGQPEGWNYKFRILKNTTNAASWVNDICRHTSISYQLERDRNEGHVAFNNGTSVQMINQAYRDVIDDVETVKSFWSLTPYKLKDIKVEFTKPHRSTKPIKWPTDTRLKKLVWQKPLTHLAKDLKCTDAAIRKRCKKLNIDLPANGHWQKVKAQEKVNQSINT
ncbi:MAG: tyrosine-type recombinase/integrase [Coraliomargarita sp.]